VWARLGHGIVDGGIAMGATYLFDMRGDKVYDIKVLPLLFNLSC
jgi:hypothetical protein